MTRMAGGRSTQPLFELLGKGQGDALTQRAKSYIPGGQRSQPEAPGPTDEQPPAPVAQGVIPVEPAPAPMAQEPAASAGVAKRLRPGVVAVPLTLLYGAGAGVLLLVVITWTIAYGRGAAAKDREWQQTVSDSQMAIGPDPLGVEPSGRNAGSQPRPSSPDPRTKAPSDGGLLGGGRLAILSSAGVLASDPRQPGRNYLQLATLDREQAQRAIDYLAAGGVEAIGVPVVDPRTGTANNPARYAVFATVGITGEEYKNRRPVMTELEAKVARIGERYRREAKGPTDFSRPLWAKYNP